MTPSLIHYRKNRVCGLSPAFLSFSAGVAVKLDMSRARRRILLTHCLALPLRLCIFMEFDNLFSCVWFPIVVIGMAD